MFSLEFEDVPFHYLLLNQWKFTRHCLNGGEEEGNRGLFEYLWVTGWWPDIGIGRSVEAEKNIEIGHDVPEVPERVGV